MPNKWTWQPSKKEPEAVRQHIDILRRSRKLKMKEKSSLTKRRLNVSTMSRAIAVQSMPSAIDQSTSSNKSKRATETLNSLVDSTKYHSSISIETVSHRLKLFDSCPSRTLRGRSDRATSKRQKSKTSGVTQRS